MSEISITSLLRWNRRVNQVLAVKKINNSWDWNVLFTLSCKWLCVSPEGTLSLSPLKNKGERSLMSHSNKIFIQLEKTSATFSHFQQRHDRRELETGPYFVFSSHWLVSKWPWRKWWVRRVAWGVAVSLHSLHSCTKSTQEPKSIRVPIYS